VREGGGRGGEGGREGSEKKGKGRMGLRPPQRKFSGCVAALVQNCSIGGVWRQQ